MATDTTPPPTGRSLERTIQRQLQVFQSKYPGYNAAVYLHPKDHQRLRSWFAEKRDMPLYRTPSGRSNATDQSPLTEAFGVPVTPDRGVPEGTPQITAETPTGLPSTEDYLFQSHPPLAHIEQLLSDAVVESAPDSAMVTTHAFFELIDETITHDAVDMSDRSIVPDHAEREETYAPAEMLWREPIRYSIRESHYESDADAEALVETSQEYLKDAVSSCIGSTVEHPVYGTERLLSPSTPAEWDTTPAVTYSTPRTERVRIGTRTLTLGRLFMRKPSSFDIEKGRLEFSPFPDIRPT